MRDKARIKPFLEKLNELWLLHPDMRFGQIVYMLENRTNADSYNMEENEWLVIIEKEIEKKL